MERVDPDATSALVVLKGDLDLGELDRVRSLLPAPDASSRVLIDCSAVTFMDSAIIALIALFRHEFQKAGHNPRDITIVASPAVERIFEISGVKRVMTVVPPPQATRGLITP